MEQPTQEQLLAQQLQATKARLLDVMDSRDQLVEVISILKEQSHYDGPDDLDQLLKHLIAPYQEQLPDPERPEE